MVRGCVRLLDRPWMNGAQNSSLQEFGRLIARSTFYGSAVLTIGVLLLLVLLPGRSLSQAEEPRIRINSITLKGNRVTKERIIIRELVCAEGDTVSSEEMYERFERSRQNLMNTGLFNTVSVLPFYTGRYEVTVEVVVNERWYLWPSIIFDLADPNFNTWWLTKDFSRVNYGAYLYRYNMRGRNETGYVLAQFGYTKQFGARYRVPNLDQRQRWGFNVGVSYDEQAEITAGTVDNKRILLRNDNGSNRDQWKADMEVILRRSHDVRHYFRAKYTQAEVADTIVQVARDYFNGSSTDSHFISLGYSVVHDKRDSRVFTRTGQYQELRIDQIGIGLLSKAAPDITTVYGTTKHWWKVYDKWTLALALHGKFTVGVPSYYAQEGLGYRNYVRGYEYYVIDGAHYTLGRANVVFQLFKPRYLRMELMPLEAFRTLYFALYLNFFSDVGRVWDNRYADVNFLANRWINGSGVGLDLVTSYDQVVRGEYTFNALGEHGFFLHFTQPF
jgi:outer membrane protein assembly factor BamA